MTLTKIGDEYTYIYNGSNASSQAASQFAMNAPAIIGEDNTLEKVRDYLVAVKGNDKVVDDKGNVKDYGKIYRDFTNRSIAAMLSVSYDEQIVVVSVTHVDEKIALDVAEAFRNMVPGQMDYYYGIENKYSSSDSTGDSTSSYENIKSIAKALNTVSSDNVVETGRRTVLYAAIGFVLGAVAVFATCLLRTYFDNTIYTDEDLKNYFTLPIVGQIPGWDNDSATNTAKKAEKKLESKDLSDRDYTGRLLNSKTPFAITEAFKSLRTNMCYTTKGEKCAVYGITSAYVQAGKSLVIANLAVSFSMMNKKVLLLDGDLRCPVQHKVFKIGRASCRERVCLSV